MVDDSIAPDIKQFIFMNIDSIARLEALLLMRIAPVEKWDAAAVAKRLYISEMETITLLAGLCERGLLTASADDPLHYTYRPASDDLARMVDRLAEIYSEHLVLVTNLIHSYRDAKQA